MIQKFFAFTGNLASSFYSSFRNGENYVHEYMFNGCDDTGFSPSAVFGFCRSRNDEIRSEYPNGARFSTSHPHHISTGNTLIKIDNTIIYFSLIYLRFTFRYSFSLPSKKNNY